jgi:hypothetical protein
VVVYTGLEVSLAILGPTITVLALIVVVAELILNRLAPLDPE